MNNQTTRVGAQRVGRRPHPANPHAATFDELIRQAAGLLDDASPQVPGLGVAALSAAVRAHPWLSVGLLRVAERLLSPPSGAARHSPAVRPKIPPRLAHVMRSLESLPSPAAPGEVAEPLARALLRVGSLLGAAADLLATHRDPGGLDRSPESSRLRHPAFLGHALREWTGLLAKAHNLAELLAARGSELGLPGVELEAVRAFPAAPRPPASSGPPLPVTVARPGGAGPDPLDQLGARLGQLRFVAWSSARTGRVSTAVAQDLAAVGMALEAATVQLTATAASAGGRRAAGNGLTSRVLARVEADSLARANGWAAVGRLVAQVRSVSLRGPGLERVSGEVMRQLRKIASGEARAVDVRGLAELGHRYAEVAGWLGQALLAMPDRELHLVGRPLSTWAKPGTRLRKQAPSLPVSLRLELDACCRALAPSPQVRAEPSQAVKMLGELEAAGRTVPAA